MTDETNKIVPIKKGKKARSDSRKASERKFGKPVMDLGFCISPSLLMQAQRRLGLNPVQFNIVMHLVDIWWDADRLPFPTKKLIAERMGMSERQVQRQIVELEQAELVVRRARTRPGGGTTSNEYDLSGLVERLRELEPEFREVREENRKRRSNVARPKHKREA